MDVQQQVIMHNDGKRVQVFRVIKIGPHHGPHHQGGHIQQLANIEEKLAQDNPKETVEKKVVETQSKDEADKVEVPKVEEKPVDISKHVPQGGSQNAPRGGSLDIPQPEPEKPEIINVEHKMSQDGSAKVVELTKRIKLKDIKSSEIPKTASPPESVFAKLGPSRNRYTILRDEL